jgi:hypothetical protein
MSKPAPTNQRYGSKSKSRDPLGRYILANLRKRGEAQKKRNAQAREREMELHRNQSGERLLAIIGDTMIAGLRTIYSGSDFERLDMSRQNSTSSTISRDSDFVPDESPRDLDRREASTRPKRVPNDVEVGKRNSERVGELVEGFRLIPGKVYSESVEGDHRGEDKAGNVDGSEFSTEGMRGK